MAKPILFCDFDGVLCFDRYWQSLPEPHKSSVQAFLFGGDLTIVNSWMRGGYTAEEVNQMLADHLGMPFDELWAIFVSDAESMRVSESTLAAIQALRENFTTILITGNMDSFLRFTVPALRLDESFDYIVSSHPEKLHKTDEGGKLFLKYAAIVGIPIEECIVLDDSLAVCATFAALGGTAHLVTKEKPVDHYLAEVA